MKAERSMLGSAVMWRRHGCCSQTQTISDSLYKTYTGMGMSIQEPKDLQEEGLKKPHSSQRRNCSQWDEWLLLK